MKIDVATKAIVDTWDAAWTAVQPTVPYVLDNEQFSEPNPTSAWLRLAIRHAGASKLTLSRPARYKRYGNIMIQIFSPVDQGRLPLDTLAKAAIDVFETNVILVSGETVTTYSAGPRDSPADGQWAQMTIAVDFDYYDFH